MHYILCKDNNWTATLKKEITADFTKSCSILEGYPLVKIFDDTNLENEYIAFSTTALINIKIIPEDSISKQVKEVLAEVSKNMSEGMKICAHFYGLTEKFGIIETGRADIVKEKVIQGLSKKSVSINTKNYDSLSAFLQVLIMPDRSIALSFLSEEEVSHYHSLVSHYHSLVSPFIGGFNNIADDKAAPSRAFKKIVEAQILLGKKIANNDRVIDLGACPGGWTYIAHMQGAQVTAIDRSALEEKLMSEPNITFKKQDAFRYKSDEVIDWVISDIICAPTRILELLEYWVLGKNCKNFVFTIKFQGQRDYGVLKKFKNFAKKSDYKIILKQLNSNKNEVTIMGSQV